MSKYIFDTGITLSELSQKASVPYTTVQEYFSSGKDIRKCSVGTLKAFADALGVTMDYLYEKLTPKKKPEKKNKYAGVKIPERFKVTFWDRNLNDIDLDFETDFVIVRLLTHGGFDGMSFVENVFSKEDIIHAVKTGRDFNPVVANFIRNRYRLDKCDMNYYICVHNDGRDWRLRNVLESIG